MRGTNKSARSPSGPEGPEAMYLLKMDEVAFPESMAQLMYVLAGKHNYAATSQSCTVGKQLKPGDVISIC